MRGISQRAPLQFKTKADRVCRQVVAVGSREGECRLLLPGACGPRLSPCEERRTLFRGVEPLTQPDGPQHSCHWQLL